MPPDNPLLPSDVGTDLGGGLTWMGTKPPISPGDAARTLFGMTGVPDLLAAKTAFDRGEVLPAIGQGAVGVLQAGSLLAPVTKPVGLALREGLEAIPGALADATGTFRAYHGTPHTFPAEEGAPFGRFKDEAIGSGEGTQAYGWGHYVAGNPKVAENYKPSEGALLEVHVLPEEHELLDWDKPLSQQPDIQQKLHSIGVINLESKEPGAVSLANQATGSEIYQRLASRGPGGDKLVVPDQETASRTLHEAGIPGLKYLDAGSRFVRSETRFEGQPIPSVPYQDVNGNWRTVDDYSPQEQVFSRLGRGRSMPETPEELATELADVKRGLKEDILSDKGFVEQQNKGNAKYSIQMPVLPAYSHYLKALDWLVANQDKFHIYTPPQSRNYVIFDPSNLRITARNGQRLEPVDHDPFAEPSK